MSSPRDSVRISACVPAYNRADRFPELLDSILGQPERAPDRLA